MCLFGLLVRMPLLSCIVLSAFLLTESLAAEVGQAPRRTFWQADNGGAFAQAADGKNWTETNESGTRFAFVIAAEEKDYVELLDASRDIAIRLYENRSSIRVGKSEFKPFLKGRWEEAPKDAAPKSTADDVAPAEPTDRRVRLIYFVPQDRKPADKYEEKIRTIMEIVNSVYRHEFRRRGWKSDGLSFELDSQDKPKVHLVRGKENAHFYSGAPNYNDNRQWKTFLPEIPREIARPFHNLIVGFLETYDEAPAPVEWLGGIALGAPFSADGGVGIFTAWILKDEFAATSEAAQIRLLQDQTPIPGRTARGHGRIDSPRFEFIEDGIGAVVHEIGHALGLPHDLRDRNSIMGQGFRSLGNNFRPSLPLQQRAKFSDDCALLLKISRFLNPAADLGDSMPPEATLNVEISGSGPVKLKVDVTDDRGLRALVVFDVVQDSIVTGRPLSGKKYSKVISLPLKRDAQGAVKLRVLVGDGGGHITTTPYP